MKIIRIVRLDPRPEVDFHPDSALLLPGRPFFMPDFGDGWEWQVHLAVHICRLGKNIGGKFAERYYDGIAPALRARLTGDQESEGMLSGMDSTIVHGDWLDASAAEAPVTVACGAAELTAPPAAAMIARAIHEVSLYTTVKMGDILLLPFGRGMSLPLVGRSRYELSVNGGKNMSLKVV